MASREMVSATETAIQQATIYLVWFIRLDFVSEPVYIHSGIGDITFSSGTGVDPALVGFTFSGAGNIGTIGTMTDTLDGSQSVNLTLPGVDLNLDYLHQIVNNGDLWQRQAAYIWLGTFDQNGAMIGYPTRVKTGRMDRMPIVIDPDSGTGTITVTIESQQSYSGTALNTRYVENSQIDSTDFSQNYIYDLANRVPEIGNTSTDASAQKGGVINYGNYYTNPYNDLK